MILFLEQLLNGLQFGVMLFLMASGLTLVFGIMNLVNLAHGSFYMIGAFVAAAIVASSGSFVLGLLGALLATAILGIAVEMLIFRVLYKRDHLEQILATFGIILFCNEAVQVIWGKTPLFFDIPAALSGSVELLPGLNYPLFRIGVIGVGIVVAIFLYLLINRTRLGMAIRAGSSDREMIAALGVNIKLLYSLVFGLGALLAALAGVMAGPILSVESGMGESILILTFVVIVIGGIGSIKGALAGAVLVGVVDTLGRAFMPELMRMALSGGAADSMGAALSSILIYLLMAVVLIFRPRGLFNASH
ncbi:ABC transporter permease [Pokkaliibacter plantistimulans]|uniref:ABC transporter permease n=2 Tax=Pseudomonadota TaxID=1224 RepID=A0ABX5M007_9GAMM|nr:branched-chain amino acid ABC transporter permease [Pokkaliibacter plantistimulans]PPC75175.1 branched-chain amino acid ABC transporter permease [Pokkaliibacter plantistimulans]PXF31250.1 ABC transporter permease [Pokkaliibacter plantistimulans]